MSRVRIEWVCLCAPSNSGGAANQPLQLFGAAEVLAVGASPVTVSAPTPPQGEAGVEAAAFVRVTGLSGAVNVAWGAAPSAAEATGWRVECGGFALLPVKSGQSISLVQAVDAPAAIAATPTRAVGTDRSGATASASVAQDLMAANADRSGWLIQNQSSANLYVRSKGAADGTAATADNHSLIVPPGGYYEPPKVTPHALSILGAASGQAFFAEEW